MWQDTKPYAVTLVVLSLLFGSAGPTSAEPESSRAGEAGRGSLTATCRLVDTQSREIEVITGVGLSLRLVKFRVGPECQIKVAGLPAQIDDIKPGEIVRIEYRKVTDQNVAERIETLRPPKAGGAR